LENFKVSNLNFAWLVMINVRYFINFKRQNLTHQEKLMINNENKNLYIIIHQVLTGNMYFIFYDTRRKKKKIENKSYEDKRM